MAKVILKNYIVRTPLLKDGQRVADGEVVELDDSAAAELQACGAIELAGLREGE